MEALDFKHQINQILSSRYEKTEELCQKHSSPIFVGLDGEKICFSCVKDTNDLIEENIAVKAYEKDIRGYMKRHSIVPDKNLKQAKFKKFEINNESQKEVLDKARKLTKLYLKGNHFNTILTGSAGAGKSHLAMAMLKNINSCQEPKRCLFVNVSSLVQLIRNTFSGYSEMSEYDYISMMSKPDYLVIDDLGSETGRIGTRSQASDFISRILYEILNNRQDKSTIITTNLTSDDINRMYDSKLISRMYRGIKKYNSIISFNDLEDYRINGIKF